MKIQVQGARNTRYPFSWNQVKMDSGLWEDDKGSVVITPRVAGSSYAVYRNGRLDFSGRPVNEYNYNREARRYRKYAGSIVLSN